MVLVMQHVLLSPVAITRARRARAPIETIARAAQRSVSSATASVIASAATVSAFRKVALSMLVARQQKRVVV